MEHFLAGIARVYETLTRLSMNRRQVLRVLAALPFMTCSGQLLALPSVNSNKFLLVFLRGGYDAANLLIPVSSSFYYESRPNIAIAKPGLDVQNAKPLAGRANIDATKATPQSPKLPAAKKLSRKIA